MMAVVAAMMSTITTATTPPVMATVLSALEAELADGSEGAAICGGGPGVRSSGYSISRTHSNWKKKFIESDRLMHTINWIKKIVQ